jgi:predicted metal-dependent hydrolase
VIRSPFPLSRGERENDYSKPAAGIHFSSHVDLCYTMSVRSTSTSMKQGELFPEAARLSSAELEAFLNEGKGPPVEVKTTRNRVSMITIDFKPSGEVRVRAHEQFLHAPPDVVKALRTYIRARRRSAWAVVSRYAQSIPSSPRVGRRERLRKKGSVHDLAEILDEVNRTYFSGKLRCRITWGRRAAKRKGRNRSIRFGSYSVEEGVIRVHPALDDEAVPREFVAYVVFHEMLHRVVSPDVRNGRTQYHNEAFRRLERTFPHWRRMQALSKKLLHELT